MLSSRRLDRFSAWSNDGLLALTQMLGGGCLSDLLAQIPLRWIMKKASLHGLAFRSDVELDGDVLGVPISDSYKDFMSGAYCKMSRRHYRPIGADPEERGDGTHRNVNETIDIGIRSLA